MNKKGFKGFGPGLICRGKQYAEHTTFEEKGGEICGAGMMHYCVNPFNVLDHYPLINEDCKLNEFAEVEAMAEPVTDDGKKFATKKLHVGAKLDFKGFVKACFDFVYESVKAEDGTASGDNSKLAASGYSSQLAASGEYSQLAASGEYSQLAASGYSSQLAASGKYSQLAASGDNSQLAASGDNSQLAASGDNSKLAASGDNSKLAASGYSSKLAASGEYSQLAASGKYSQLAASGKYSQLAASGYSSQLAASGERSVIAGIGINNRAKAALGCWIVLAEWEWDGKHYVPVCVKAGQIDGGKLKADTWYRLKNGEFVEVE